jgi:hypothetical protein
MWDRMARTGGPADWRNPTLLGLTGHLRRSLTRATLSAVSVASFALKNP